MSIILAVP